MIFVDRDILEQLETGQIVIQPFDREALGTNSYDVHLAPLLRVYDVKSVAGVSCYLDVRQQPETKDIVVPDGGVVLYPGELYLASTIEYTESHAHVPILNGKSSLGRLGLSIHVTAGTGDVGFCNHWTLEMTVIKPLKVYAGMPIGQILWFAASSRPLVPYGLKRDAKYAVADSAPGASRMYKNFKEDL